MEAAHPAQPQDFNSAPNGSFRNRFADSARFWEFRRLFYNLALAIVVLLWIAISWPHFRPAFVLSTLFPLLALALIANLFYSAAYLLDIPMLLSPFSAEWKRRRWILWTVGTLFAILLANYWIADEIYPFVR
ncbi:MAG TPA: hypothetical protein VMI32_08190 [Candidatus Solibacter sp.]|nr:hypothetical protein [Candidatus Solibacter sp.]